MRQRFRLAAITLAVAAGGWVLTGPLARVLPAPAVTSPARWRAWLETTDPVTAVVTVLRLVAVVMSGWLALGLVATAVIGAAGHGRSAASSWGRAVHGAARTLHAAMPRPLLTTGALFLGAASAGCARHQGVTRPPTQGSGRGGPAVTLTMAQADPPRMPSPPRMPAPPQPAVARWVVHRGDSMWSVAEAVVGAHGGTQAQVGPYWLEVVRSNHRSEPDVIYPGDVLDLPTYPGC